MLNSFFAHLNLVSLQHQVALSSAFAHDQLLGVLQLSLSLQSQDPE